MSDRFDESDEDDDDYFAEVDDGDDTGKAPKFVLVPDLSVPAGTLGDYKVDDLMAMYIALRNQLSTDRKGWKARESKMKAQMLTISMILLGKADALGVTNLGGSTGSGYAQNKEKLKVAPDGWLDLCAWIKQTGNFQVLQKRVSSDAVKDIRENDGALPPGVESAVERVFVVRSPTARKR